MKSGRHSFERYWRCRRPVLPMRIAAIGPNARAVLKGARGVVHRLGHDKVDIVVTDDQMVGQGEVPLPIASLAETPALAVPAFDPRLHNPVGWQRDVAGRLPAALGPLRHLPDDVLAHRVRKLGGRSRLRRSHHLVDTAAFHRDAVERTGTLVRLAATGLPIRLVDHDPRVAALLGSELHDLLTSDLRQADAAERESHSIRTRRVALRDHTLKARLRRICSAARVGGAEVPTVSLLLATRRPRLLPWAIESAAKQNYPRLQLAVALHGDGFDERDVEHALSVLSIPIQVTRVSGHRSYGAVLGAATSVATGSLLTTLDDDDLYGVDHIWDLVLAREYAEAELVGKGAETIYLAGSDRTVRRYVGSGESYSGAIAGSALMIGREDLERFGGWRDVPFADRALQEDVVRGGGRVYRTHGAGYMPIRHGDRHAWPVDEEYFMKSANSVHPGWHPRLADIDAVPRPSHCCV